MYHTLLFIYKDMFLLVFSLLSPHVFSIARSPELIVVIPKTSNTSCSFKETFDILFIVGYEHLLLWGQNSTVQGKEVAVMAHVEATTCQGDSGRTYFES